VEPSDQRRSKDYPEQLRIMERIAHAHARGRTEAVPVECVARGYLAGSGWKEYKSTGEVCGIKLPAGLVESSRLSEADLYTFDKSGDRHDENISEKKMAELIGADLTRTLKDLTLSIYKRAAQYAEERALLFATRNLEFGI